MTYLAENALAICVGGAVLVTLALVVYLQTRSSAALKGLGAVVLLTALLLVYSWLVVTPREAVERTLYSLAAVVEANDLEGTLDHIAPAASEVRAEAEAVMPLVTVEKARVVSTPQFELSPPDDPTEAVVRFRAFGQGTVHRGGQKGAAMDDVAVTFVRAGDRWLVKSYSAKKDWRREAGL